MEKRNIREIPSSLFLDSSFLISFFAKEDQYFRRATKLKEHMMGKKVVLYTIWPMVSETATLLLYRYNNLYAINFLNSLGAYEIILPSYEEYTESIAIFKNWNNDQQISLNDFLARTVIKNRLNNIPVLTFDSDFSKMGLTVFKP